MVQTVPLTTDSGALTVKNIYGTSDCCYILFHSNFLLFTYLHTVRKL